MQLPPLSKTRAVPGDKLSTSSSTIPTQFHPNHHGQARRRCHHLRHHHCHRHCHRHCRHRRHCCFCHCGHLHRRHHQDEAWVIIRGGFAKEPINHLTKVCKSSSDPPDQQLQCTAVLLCYIAAVLQCYSADHLKFIKAPRIHH